MSNPNPQNGTNTFGKLTSSKIAEINKKNGITVQGFPGIFENGVHYKFGKKVIFEEPYSY